MNQERLLKIILAPVVSEKSTLIAEKSHQYVFSVLPDATKPEIKKAIELLFKVTVLGVRVCNVKGKTKVFRQKPGRRKSWKKAYITLKEGDDINFMGAQ